jgi:hypothetical protein
MQLMAALRKPVNIVVASLMLALSSVSGAETIEESPSAGAMVADAVFARPLYFVMSQAGALIYGVTLPFTLLGGNADEAAETFVVTPLQAAFVRCLGCGKIPNEVGEVKEGEGKTIRHFVMLNGGLTMLDTESKKSTGAGGGIFMGTHFELADKSRFDVMLGVKMLGDIEMKKPSETITDNMMSYQIVTRFGKEVFWGMDLMFKLGLHSWTTDRDYEVSGVTTSGSTSGVDFLWGLGLDKDLGSSIRLGLDYTSYGLENSDDGYDASINTLDMNLSFMF